MVVVYMIVPNLVQVLQWGDVTCNGGADGSVVVSATGAFASPTYLWDNGSVLDSIGGLAAGSYSCIVTDTAHSCVDTVLAIVNEPAGININAVTTAVMPGQTNGAVNITVTGGTLYYCSFISNT